MNKVILTGRLVESNILNNVNERYFLKNVLAVKKNYKDKNGEVGTNFIKVIFWGQNAKFIHDYTNKGDLIGVVGSWENRTYETPEGKTLYISECVVESTEILNKVNRTNNTINNNDVPYYDDITGGDLPF